ncbi:hypothetical protein CHU98_g4817 [Xylaria longipes]|nr:hypothetical protein CHU98_g4817 [Xylaria longipes]
MSTTVRPAQTGGVGLAMLRAKSALRRSVTGSSRLGLYYAIYLGPRGRHYLGRVPSGVSHWVSHWWQNGDVHAPPYNYQFGLRGPLLPSHFEITCAGVAATQCNEADSYTVPHWNGVVSYRPLGTPTDGNLLIITYTALKSTKRVGFAAALRFTNAMCSALHYVVLLYTKSKRRHVVKKMEFEMSAQISTVSLVCLNASATLTLGKIWYTLYQKTRRRRQDSMKYEHPLLYLILDSLKLRVVADVDPTQLRGTSRLRSRRPFAAVPQAGV